MKKLLHTPGPWLNHGADGVFDGRTHGPSIQDKHGRVICAVETVDGDGEDYINDRRLADAQLIAAAPEMLQVLMGFVRQMEAGVFPNLAHAKAIEVIKKAVGDE